MERQRSECSTNDVPSLRPLRKLTWRERWRRFRVWLRRHANYQWLFWAYFMLLPLVGGGLGMAIIHGNIPFIDSLFLAASAVTESGLATVQMTQLNNGFFAMLLVLIIIGSQVAMLFPPLLIRRYLYWRWYGMLIRRERELRRQLAQFSPQELQGLLQETESPAASDAAAGKRASRGVESSEGDSSDAVVAGKRVLRSEEFVRGAYADAEDVEAQPSTSGRAALRAESWGGPLPVALAETETLPPSNNSLDAHRAPSKDGSVADDPNRLYRARHSICLLGNEMARHATLEYEAMGKLLMLAFGFYACVIVVFTPLVFAAVVGAPGPSPALAQEGVSTGWFAVFTMFSALHNCGLVPLNANMVPVRFQAGLLFLYGVLIILGNTGLPIVLYGLVWLGHHFSKDKSAYTYLLLHGRRFTMFLFSGAQTLVLGLMLIALNVVQYVVFLALSLDRSSLLVDNSAGSLVYQGLFQTVSTRNAGFSVVNFRDLSPALLVVYVVMMYLSPVPYVLTLRSTARGRAANRTSPPEGDIVSQEDPPERNVEAERPRPIRQQGLVFSSLAKKFGNVLMFDVVWLFLALFVICIAENYLLDNRPSQVATVGYVSVFDILFELTSAYGNVGLSVGVNNADYSLSGVFNTFSKLIIIATMIGGRNRLFPRTHDDAIRFTFDREMCSVTRESLMAPEQRLRELKRRRSKSVSTDGRPPFLSAPLHLVNGDMGR
ncbi:hypothetical protein CDCA_CDCA04G1429 [Cyanidium caldarium]|uniref:Uncharacterized protein n=1 Tax=Cyanidium caldarium TaxID=2771 RepID=A0AAV9IT37_CYACA|nr:hypothetical protein CDCA_CDCA04G1429 [Cyanidium caldarium]